ncbi:hypothetical protein SLE2022_230990 [Rubroshorea leprosula]
MVEDGFAIAKDYDDLSFLNSSQGMLKSEKRKQGFPRNIQDRKEMSKDAATFKFENGQDTSFHREIRELDKNRTLVGMYFMGFQEFFVNAFSHLFPALPRCHHPSGLYPLVLLY